MASIDISDEQEALYRDEGYMILELAIGDHQLEMLRDQCRVAMERMEVT